MEPTFQNRTESLILPRSCATITPKVANFMF